VQQEQRSDVVAASIAGTMLACRILQRHYEWQVLAYIFKAAGCPMRLLRADSWSPRMTKFCRQRSSQAADRYDPSITV
jgi:hypothetical protein